MTTRFITPSVPLKIIEVCKHGDGFYVDEHPVLSVKFSEDENPEYGFDLVVFDTVDECVCTFKGMRNDRRNWAARPGRLDHKFVVTSEQNTAQLIERTKKKIEDRINNAPLLKKCGSWPPHNNT